MWPYPNLPLSSTQDQLSVDLGSDSQGVTPSLEEAIRIPRGRGLDGGSGAGRGEGGVQNRA